MAFHDVWEYIIFKIITFCCLTYDELSKKCESWNFCWFVAGWKSDWYESGRDKDCNLLVKSAWWPESLNLFVLITTQDYYAIGIVTDHYLNWYEEPLIYNPKIGKIICKQTTLSTIFNLMLFEKMVFKETKHDLTFFIEHKSIKKTRENEREIHIYMNLSLSLLNSKTLSWIL